MPGSESLFHMHALFWSDDAILMYILHSFALGRGLKWGATAQSPPKYALDVHVLMVTAY